MLNSSFLIFLRNYVKMYTIYRLVKKIHLMTYVSIFFVIIIVIYISMDEENIRIGKKFACHYSKSGDAIQSITNETFLPPPHSIFFIETSCQGSLTLRQACVVESAARLHPKWQINVLFTSSVKQAELETDRLKELLHIKNVKFGRIHIEEYIRGTPISELLKNSGEHVGLLYLLKYITLYKYSGVYLDLDVIVARSFEELARNWIVKESPESISTAMFSFSNDFIGRKLSQLVVSHLVATDKKESQSDNGPLMRRLLSVWCDSTNIESTLPDRCKGLEIYHTGLFYPLAFNERQNYFKPFAGTRLHLDWVFTFPTWELYTKYEGQSDTLYEKLANQHCPTIYSRYGSEVMIN